MFSIDAYRAEQKDVRFTLERALVSAKTNSTTLKEAIKTEKQLDRIMFMSNEISKYDRIVAAIENYMNTPAKYPEVL
jgi:hypothetical protein